MTHDKLTCDNYRGISILSHCEKAMAAVTTQMIRNKTEGSSRFQSQAKHNQPNFYIDEVGREILGVWSLASTCTHAM